MPKSPTTIFLPNLGFKAGAASCFDLWGQTLQIQFPDNPEETDYLAMAADWEAVKQDFEKAVKQFRKENNILTPEFR
ncbi:MAG: hypothetical protein PHV05_08960 [Candidatus Riflebacteria bacterium]|nr:hypothetical protein [Candidatus Riflebacteria bacterium]